MWLDPMNNTTTGTQTIWTSVSPSLYPTTAAPAVDKSPIVDEHFSPAEVACPKCLLGNLNPDNGTHLHLRFLEEKDVAVCGELIHFPEMIRIECGRCGYAWRMHPADCDCWEDE